VRELGKKDEIFGADLLVPLGLYRRPDKMPVVPEGHSVVCGYDLGLGERMIVCDSLEEMQKLYDMYAQGFALNIVWYSAPDPGFLTVVGFGPDKEAESSVGEL
jgi:hypothetical protein